MNRIKEVREKLGINQAELANTLGIKNSILSEIENGKREISKTVLIGMLEKFNVNANWLLTGEGSMFLEPEQKAPAEAGRKIPLLRQTVSCGPGSSWEDSDIVEEFLEPVALLPSLPGRNIYAFKVRGTSMVGAGIEDGDVILFDASTGIDRYTDDLYVFALDGNVFCKLLKFDPIRQTIKIYSLHSTDLKDAEELRTLDCSNPSDVEALHIFGRVIAWLRENRLINR